MPDSTSNERAGHRLRRKLVIVPLLCLGLAAAAPAHVSSPAEKGQATAQSPGKQGALQGQALASRRGGPPAGFGGGRKV